LAVNIAITSEAIACPYNTARRNTPDDGWAGSSIVYETPAKRGFYEKVTLVKG
jgi:hypothetical protein